MGNNDIISRYRVYGDQKKQLAGSKSIVVRSTRDMQPSWCYKATKTEEMMWI